MPRFARPLPALALLLALLPARAPAQPVLPAVDGELAIVNDDTLRVSDLRSELDRMRARQPAGSPLSVPPPEDVLRRMVQNTLLTQEGYRLGLDREALVRGAVEENVRNSTVSALLDSVADAVPAGAPERDQARVAAVEAFVKEACRRQGARVDEPLLASLDFASADSAVQQSLRQREDVVASVGASRLTVHGLWRRIRFTFFHGLQGRDDAVEIRDRFCREWVEETALAREAAARGYRDRPAVRAAARRVERDLVREEALKTLLSFTFKPTDQEIAAWHRAHPEAFTPPPRIKVESALFADSTTAFQFRDRLRQGARFRWLAARTAEIVKDVVPFPTDWLPPSALGLEPAEARAGAVLEPYGVPGGWAVAAITEVEKPVPAPLDKSRDRVLTLMRNERARDTVTEALRRLEEAAAIRTAPDALALIRGELAAFEGGDS